MTNETLMFLNSLRLGCAGLPSRLSSSAENEFCPDCSGGLGKQRLHNQGRVSPLTFMLRFDEEQRCRDKHDAQPNVPNGTQATSERKRLIQDKRCPRDQSRPISTDRISSWTWFSHQPIVCGRNSVAVAEQYTHFPLKIWKSEAVTVHCQLMLSIRISL